MSRYYLMGRRDAEAGRLEEIREPYGPPYHYCCDDLQVAKDVAIRCGFTDVVLVEDAKIIAYMTAEGWR